MGRTVVVACLPWVAWSAIACLLLFLLLRATAATINLARLRQIHRDEVGGAQSLSFVLALPVLIMVVMFIVQISQLMIATVVVEYSAYAAARAAAVWIPARISGGEGANCISSYVSDPTGPDQAEPSPLGPTTPACGSSSSRAARSTTRSPPRR